MKRTLYWVYIQVIIILDKDVFVNKNGLINFVGYYISIIACNQGRDLYKFITRNPMQSASNGVGP